MLYCTQEEINELIAKLGDKWPKEKRRQADIISLLSKRCHGEIVKEITNLPNKG